MPKCFRAIDPVQEPTDCIQEKCSAWISSGNFSGCAFVLSAQTTALTNFIKLREDYNAGKSNPPRDKEKDGRNDAEDSKKNNKET